MSVTISVAASHTNTRSLREFSRAANRTVTTTRSVSGTQRMYAHTHMQAIRVHWVKTDRFDLEILDQARLGSVGNLDTLARQRH